MWRRAYLILILVRLYFALSPSYLHPDENFQGPEVIAGEIFGYPNKLTWEYTSTAPIRSVFPLWIAYGGPLYLLRLLYSSYTSSNDPPPTWLVYYALRILMFTLSFVLEDWAIHELAEHKRHRRIAVVLIASSYATWTFQTHTFSNSIETLLVLWSLVLIARIKEDAAHSSPLASAILAACAVTGTFNRITFPAWLLLPGLSMLPHFWRHPMSLAVLILSAALTAFVALDVDTSFYISLNPSMLTAGSALKQTLMSPVITPLNSLRYNTSYDNLRQHGIHPYYQHLAANLPQLLGPAIPLFLHKPRQGLRFYAAICGIVTLSFIPHQEARFLLPAVPLLLSSIRLPRRQWAIKLFVVTWVSFNTILGALMGVWHQGGVVPAQLWLGGRANHAGPGISKAFWWKTYSPPVWMANGSATKIETVDLMGMQSDDMIRNISASAPCMSGSGIARRLGIGKENDKVVLLAPYSATFLDRYVRNTTGREDLRLTAIWEYKEHLNLDDLDIPTDGVLGTWRRVVQRRGLVIWNVEKRC